MGKPLGEIGSARPAGNLARASAVAKRDAAESAGGKRARILIVDDDATAVHALHHALASTGAQIAFAADAEQALRLARELLPDVVLLDIQMPDVDGFEVCARLRLVPELTQIPIVFVTRHSDVALEARALELGATDFIAKPYSPAVLRARVGNVLRLQAQADAALRAEREHWQQVGHDRVADIVSSASDAIVSADAHGNVVLINEAACQMFMVDARAAIGQPLAQLLDTAPQAAGPRDPAFETFRWNGVRAAHRMVVRLSQNGEPFPVEVSVSSLGEGDERLTTVILRDLRERERAEAAERDRLAAEAVSQAKTLMLSYMAHEIGNPLNAIVGFGQLMEDDLEAVLPAEQRMRLSYVMNASRHLQNLMSDVLDLHGFEAGRFACSTDALDVINSVRDALQAVSASAALALVTLCFEPPAGQLTIAGDATRLRQCLVNLLGNAIKYNVRNGRVVVTTRSSGERVLIDVRDSGPGMTSEQLTHLFEPFNRLGRAGEGSGLGLALTRQLVVSMGGQITVSSEIGQGSCFTLDLPALRD